VAQKEALAATLRVLPYYDELVIDPARRTDPEVVLEGYSAIWHYDRETHLLSISDEVDGEDGLVEFDGTDEASTVLYDGLGLTLTSGPLTRVDVNAEFTWTQLAQGTVSLTRYLLDEWMGPGARYITSMNLQAGDWPKPGASLGDGWLVDTASALSLFNEEIIPQTFSSTVTVKFPDSSWFGPSTTTTTYTENKSVPQVGPGSIGSHPTVTDKISVVTSPEAVSDYGTSTYTSSYSRSYSQTWSITPMNFVVPTLVAGYSAKRQCTELVSFSLFADVQHVLTSPEDGEALRIDDIRSVNLSESIGEGTDAYVPIGDPRRRSYIATDRGNRSLEHLIALARAHLLKRARVVEIAFVPRLSRMPEITLRKNAFLVEPRVGEAVGKIIGYSVALDGSDGRIKCEAVIGCVIGRGGSAVEEDGVPTYCSIDYTGADYQQFTGRTILFLDSSVGYQPPAAHPNDDGINFLYPLTVNDVIQIPFNYNTDNGQVTFKLKSMNRSFSTDYDVQVTDLKITTGYDLEAA
jgi:hypothetical protein